MDAREGRSRTGSWAAVAGAARAVRRRALGCTLCAKYVFFIMAVLVAVLGATFWAINRKHEQLVMAQINMQAKTLFQQIVITRKWVAEHGGVYVEKLPWMQPNPYLPKAAITDREGKRYLKENPAMVTKQLSRYAEREHLYVFHITSLKLVNPENAPDAFERAALLSFEAGAAKEATTVERIGPARYYRYVAPLFVEAACLECHRRQGYQVGDVKGAISVSIPIDEFIESIRSERRYMVAGTFLIGAIVVLTLFLVTRRVIIAPIRRIQEQMRAFPKPVGRVARRVEGGDEIDSLAGSFAEMARTLEEYHTGLEEKVAAATRELSARNEALARSSQEKSEFLAKTSHELRTPLTAIKGAMDYLSVKLAQREADADQDLVVFFEMIKKSAERLIRLVNVLLDYERIGLGAAEMSFREASLRAAFEEVLAGFAPLAAERGVSIRAALGEAGALVDEDRIKQVLTNLLSNALSASPDGAPILVTLEQRGEEVYAAVEDRGPGIAPGEREEIFRHYYTKNVTGGTGLGLAICRGIVEAHGGRIGVEGPPLGGSRFWFAIPRQGKGAATHG
jgi:signal transduction histidine kinase